MIIICYVFLEIVGWSVFSRSDLLFPTCNTCSPISYTRPAADSVHRTTKWVPTSQKTYGLQTPQNPADRVGATIVSLAWKANAKNPIFKKKPKYGKCWWSNLEWPRFHVKGLERIKVRCADTQYAFINVHCDVHVYERRKKIPILNTRDITWGTKNESTTLCSEGQTPGRQKTTSRLAKKSLVDAALQRLFGPPGLVAGGGGWWWRQQSAD